MDFRTELAKWGYNKGNSVDVETLIDEILPSLFSKQGQDKKLYTEQEVKYLLEVQRGNCYVALLSYTKNDDIASVALGAPEPGGRNGTWVK
jgi:hypothetical protein